MEKQKQQQQRDQAKNQKQKASAEPATSTTTTATTTTIGTKQTPTTGATLQQLDPIQSIANVLNHHHSEQQKSKLSKQHKQQVSATDAKKLDSLSAADGAATGEAPKSKEESDAELQRANQKRSANSRVVKPQQVDRATGRPLLLTVDNNNAGKKPSRQQVDRSGSLAVGASGEVADLVAASSSPTSKTATNKSIDYKCAQVEQGNSYLYAYNDFITPPAHLSSSLNHQASGESAPLRGSEETQQQHHQRDGQDLRIARQLAKQQQQIRAGEKKLRASAELVVGGKPSQRQANNQRTRAAPDSPSGELNLGEEVSADDDEADEADETLSYILNRHNLLVAQQAAASAAAAAATGGRHQQDCDLSHLNQFDPSLGQVPAHLLCRHQLALVENPNHLSQYLQIEENFNNYKAARHKSAPRKSAAPQPNPNSKHSAYLQRLQRAAAHDDDAQVHEEPLAQQHTNQNKQASSFLPFQHGKQSNQLLSSSLSSSESSLANLTTTTGHISSQHRQVSLAEHNPRLDSSRAQHAAGLLTSPRSYLQFLTRFAPVSLGSSNPNGPRKMYSAGQQVGQLAGQAGAYYVTTSTNPPGDRQQDANISQAHLGHHHHLQQRAHLTGAGHPNHLDAQHHQHHHPHSHLHQQHSYPVTSVTSDSSLGSSGAFASSAVRRTTGWLRDFCSKRCLFVTCLALILFIFILVISLSAYLNFLINSNKVNLQPLSGRLRVMLDSMRDEGGGGSGSGAGDDLSAAQSLRLLMAPNSNSTPASQQAKSGGQEFLQKQRDFETILRGALDRTQPMLKTYPNHLVKLEVYSFRPGQPAALQATASDLWVYFRLFVNKRSLQQDGQLMKRKSPDEQFDKQFLPRLTQQALLNGFEQLITSFGSAGAGAATPLTGPASDSLTGGTGARLALLNGKPVLDQQAAGSQVGINARRFGHRALDSPPASSQPSSASAGLRRLSRAATGQRSAAAAGKSGGPLNANQQQLKSFDEQISRLMNMIEAIDLQSIFVTPDFDMTQTMQPPPQSPSASQIMSETLKASRPIVQPATTTASSTTTTTASTSSQASAAKNNGNNVMVASGAELEPAQDRQNNNNNNNNKLLPTTTTGLKEKQLTTRQPAGELELEEEDLELGPKKPARKFTLSQSYRENATRPSLPDVSATPASSSTGKPSPAPSDSPFLVNHQQKPTQKAKAQQQKTSSTTRPANQSGPAEKLAGAQTGRGAKPQAAKADQQRGAGGNLATAAANSGQSAAVSIPDLWQSTFSGKQNVSTLEVSNNVEPADVSSRPRLITVTTIGNSSAARQASGAVANDGRPHLSPGEWQKISPLERPSDGSSAVRAQLNASANNTSTPPTTTTTTTTTTTASSSSRPPKVAPHLNFAGSLVSASVSSAGQGQKPARQQQQQHSSNSAVVLNRDLPGNNATRAGDGQQPKRQPQKVLKQRPFVANDGARAPASAAARSNSTRTSTQNKPAKLKKVASESAKNQTAPTDATPASSRPTPASSRPTPANSTTTSKGIRIVDNFLASLGTGEPAASSNKTTAGAQRQKEQAHAFLPTLPTTIELTRSTAASQPSRTTVLTETPKSATEEPDPDGGFVIASQQARPGTSSFSGQWRPLSSSQSPPASKPDSSEGADFRPVPPSRAGSTQRPRQNGPGNTRQPALTNLSLIVATERLPATMNQASGSQSPFSMPGVLQPHHHQQPAPFTNRFKAQTSSFRTTPPTNDFESHRVSRMRQSQAHSHRATDHADPFGGSTTVASSTRGSVSSSVTTTSSSNSVDSASVTPPNTRIVDDFMITTSRDDPDGRATTLLPPLVLSGLQGSAPLAQRGRPDVASGAPTISLVVAQGPKRTRGPFAFETLRSFAPVESSSEPISSPSEPSAPDSFEVSEPISSGSLRAERSSTERFSDDSNRKRQKPIDQSLPVVAQEKMLLRKRLFIDSEPGMRMTSGSGSARHSEDELSYSPSTNSPLQQLDGSDQFPAGEASARFGNRFTGMKASDELTRTPRASNKCPYFGCVPRKSTGGELVCLNSSQICDDHIDCQDESDELDCVSLLKLEPKSNRMGFSNGAGIIYLNRRGTLAPMCLDELGPEPQAEGQASELVRQINAIGQYACSLQSFARLVSVKINHHDLVDGSRQIRSSSLFHRLTVVEADRGRQQAMGAVGRQQQQQQPQQQVAGDSFKSSERYQVSISTSSECPSQRTVFVKCGDFECGRDSLGGVSAATERRAAAAAAAAELARPVVKLYHLNSLACHGYLIDESWLVAAGECFANNNTTSDDLRAAGWSAEISYEHYGSDDDHHSIEPNRRAVMDIIEPLPTNSLTTQAGAAPSSTSPIVLAKLERPVRFSPLTRPICLPSSPARTRNGAPELDRTTYRDCMTASLPWGAANGRQSSNLDASSPTQQQQQQHQKRTPDLVLNKVELAKAEDCFEGDQKGAGGERESNLICAIKRTTGDDGEGGSSPANQQDAATRVLICSQPAQASDASPKSRLRSRWVVVGVRSEQGYEIEPRPSPRANGQLFASVSSQVDWIVDTMDPKSVPASSAGQDDDRANPHLLVADSESANSNGNNSPKANYTNTPFHLRLGSSSGELTNELNPLFNNSNQQQQQTCNRFKCSSGECLSWSRICDGLYDCSSHDDEKDCHK